MGEQAKGKVDVEKIQSNREVILRYLKEFPLYERKHRVLERKISDGIWLGYRTNQSNFCQGYTHFDVNIIDGVFYILSIEIEEEHRGKGHGSDLYRVLENIAKEMGCSRIQMTPYGTTYNRESRKTYLLKRGYESHGSCEVIKHLQ